jgi:hypothetical protein
MRFLESNPQLAAWRGGPAVINAIPREAKERIRKARPNRRASAEAEEFFKVNPELKALDETHGKYEETYVRRHANRRFVDGFSLPPTLTLPQLPLHPCWYTFKKDASYWNLEFRRKRSAAVGEIEFMNPIQIQGQRRYERVHVAFRGIRRLALLRRVAANEVVTHGRDKYTWCLDHPTATQAEHRSRAAEVKGIKLIFRPATPNGTPYLVFTVALADRPRSDGADRLIKEKKVSEGLVSCAADLVMRHPHLAAVSIAVATESENGELFPRIVRTGFVSASEIEQTGKHPGRSSPGPSLKHQALHKQRLRALRRGNRAVKGSTRHRVFQQHVTNMGEDVCRKAARKLVNFALFGWADRAADVLAVENLRALRADARRERGLNTGLINWRRGHTTEWTKLFAESDGLLFREERAYWTSQVCSRCLRLGRRYTPHRNGETGLVEPRFGTVEKLFACPAPGCQIDVNADLNASVNLHRVLYGTFPRIKKDGDTIVVERARTTYDEVEREVLRRLRNDAAWLKCGGVQDIEGLDGDAEGVF